MVMFSYTGDNQMIITDRSKLEVMSVPTTIQECKDLNLFGILEHELVSSPVPGIGLAAIQCGMPLRASLIVNEKEVYRMVNPVIIEATEPIVWPNEGCLSDPGNLYNTARFNRIKITWLDYDAGKQRTAVTEGLKAVALQHEVQHMDGILNYTQVYKSPTIGRNSPCPLCEKEGVSIKWKKCKKHNFSL
jgi:peptide deformylase